MGKGNGNSGAGNKTPLGYNAGPPPFRMHNGRDIVVADVKGKIVADSRGVSVGRQIGDEALGSSAYPLETGDGTKIGTLYIVDPFTLGISSLENVFVRNITIQTLWTAMVVVIFALLLGLLLSRRITIPLQELSTAIHKVAQGELNVRVRPRGDRELVSLGQDFNLMASKLRDQEDNRRRLMSDIAHELRTPLALLRGQLEGVQSGRVEFSETNISGLVDETIRLSRLVKDLETISQAESGYLRLSVEEFEAADLLEKLSPVRMAIEDQGLNFTTKIDHNIKVIKADPNRLLQILINLLSNAMRYSEAGQEIVLSMARQNRGILFSIQDNGPGIAPEHLPYVFDRFYRADESRSSSSGGRGLGLAIARSYTEAHGGRIWVESELGKGSTFNVFIPQ